MNWIRLATLTAASALALSVYVSAGPIYTLADLGTLGGSSTMATGINDFGQTVGTATTMFGYLHAFSSLGSGLTDLTVNSSAEQGQASGINNAGQIAGTQYFGGQAYATVWNDGVANTIGAAGSYAVAINNAGEVAGMLVNNGQGNAFVTRNGTVIDLGTFAGSSWSAAYGLNDQGQAAGYGMNANGSFRAFIWTPSQGYSTLGTFGGASSYAMSINNSGIATGSAQTSSGYAHAFLSNGTTMQDLGTLGGVASYAYGINDAGNAVGFSWTTGNAAMHGFLEQGGMMWDINSLLIDAPGWVITQLYGINSSNQVVGVGIFDGVEHAVLLTDPPAPTDSAVPEPATWITGLALLALFLSLRRTRRPSR
jgi:probable HAF family extracellular repeat protein